MSLASAAQDPGRVRLRSEPEGIAWVEMIDPDGPNALSPPFVSALLAALEAASLGKVIVLSGLPEVFCSGASPALLGALVRGEIAPTELGLTRVLLDLPVPVIAACEGAAIGGGFALALACDLLVLAEESRYGLNFMSLGFTPGMGTTRLAEHVLGPAIAHELLYTGEFRRGSELRGGVNAVVPRTEVPAKALDLALRIAAQPREAIVLLKRTLTLPRRRALQEALTLESFMHGITLPPLAGRMG
ncbi:MAG: enoyl-CoA hydratase/isomerase family protein [Deltaproteobacteria bacterium]|nr:enoyl-CoA hydratase/isomerase family protein [Deltaproteobacteria bacterium]